MSDRDDIESFLRLHELNPGDDATDDAIAALCRIALRNSGGPYRTPAEQADAIGVDAKVADRVATFIADLALDGHRCPACDHAFGFHDASGCNNRHDAWGNKRVCGCKVQVRR